jgi:GH25 family lysozyme M1 (1,4-beta-N-acetylmuramidase)
MSCDLIDVSEHQHPDRIAWARVRAAGVHGAYVRAGANLGKDDRAAEHLRRAKAAGLEVGVYWYAHPGLSAALQADRLAEAHHDHACTLAPAVDIETAQGVAPVEIAVWLQSALLRIDASLERQRAIIYTGPGFWAQHLGEQGTGFGDRGLWVAHYGAARPTIPWPWDEHLLWQRAANTIWRMPDGSQAWGPVQPHPDAVAIAPPGMVDGVAGEVDCNVIGNASWDDLRAGRQPRTALDLSDVRGRQRALRRLGCDPGSLDGLWGSRSRAALVLAQRQLGLEADGVWGPGTTMAVEAAITG